jgi:hypothetical protein
MSTITATDGTTPVTYEQISLTSSEGIYRDVSSTLSNPRTIRVSHDSASSNTGTDRHLVQFARTDDDADGLPYTGGPHVVFAAPREGVTKADFLIEWKMLKNLIDAKFDDIYGGFQPTD